MGDQDAERELLSATLDVWHPDCWGIESTDEVDSGLVGHGAAVSGTSGYERCTIYGDSEDHVTQAVAVAHDSPFIKTIETLGDVASERALPSVVGKSTQDVFIEYDATEGIGSAFLSRGYVLDSTYRIETGLETWDLLVYATRATFRRSLDEIRRDRDADITLRKLSPASESSPAATRHDPHQGGLTARQREAFTLARERGYYQWPRETSASELAAELDVSKATFLEHLRKAEAELLGGPGDGRSNQ